MNNRYDADFDIVSAPKHNPSAQNSPRRVQNGPAPQNRVRPQNVRRTASNNVSSKVRKPMPKSVQSTNNPRRTAPRQKSVSDSLKASSKQLVVSGFRDVIKPLFRPQGKDLNTVKVKRKPFPFGTLVATLLCTVVVGFMILSYIQINEYTIQVSDLRSDLTELMNEDKELTSGLEQKNDLIAIEEKAEELGMVKADQLTKKNVKLTSEDKVEVVETSSSDDLNLVSTVLSGLFSNFRGFTEYFSGSSGN